MKKKTPDFLDECATAAIQMGITYGQYMARRYDMGLVQNPHTAQEPIPNAVCKWCGKPFARSKHFILYCSPECKEAVYLRRIQDAHARKDSERYG